MAENGTGLNNPVNQRAATLPIASLYVEHQVVLAAGCCACSGGTGISAASFDVVTILSSRIVKVEPQPGALATVTSPPIT
jgi:hypothetical protein